ncbi:MAG: glycosyltransferase family 2 protein [Acidimicrobiia bacterium]
MLPTPAVSAIIPVHNEAGFIDSALPRLIASMESLGVAFEVIIAENGSTDATAEIVARIGDTDDRVRIIRLPEADYGAAMRAGFLQAKGAWIVNFDIDYFSADFIRSGLRAKDSADIVLASKRVAGSDDRRSLLRRLGTWGFNIVLRVLFRSEVTDTHGMKMIRRSVVEELVPAVESTKDLFDTELVIRAERAGHRIAEVPATVEELRTARSSFVKRIPRTLVGLWRIRRSLRREARHQSAE